SRCGSRGSNEWMEWQVRQLTVAELACTPAWREMRSLLSSWQARQPSEPLFPTGLKIFSLSPPDSMCAVPSPWQVSPTAFGTCVDAAALGSADAPESGRAHTPRPWGLAANVFAWSWQSPHDGSAAGSAAGVCAVCS